DFQAAVWFLETATDYTKPNEEVRLEAVRHLLKLEPAWGSPDIYRRLLQVADQAKDAGLVKQAWTWIDKAQKKYGFDVGYASLIGDILDKYEMKAEAQAHWRRA